MKKRLLDFGSGSSKRISNGLVALSSVAIFTVYSAGYVRTRAAAARFEVPAGGRRSGQRPAAKAAPALTSSPTVSSSQLPAAVAAAPPVATQPTGAPAARAEAPRVETAQPAPEIPTLATSSRLAQPASAATAIPTAPLTASTLSPAAIPAPPSVTPSPSAAASTAPAPAPPPVSAAAPAAAAAPARTAAPAPPASSAAAPVASVPSSAHDVDPSEQPYVFHGAFKRDGTFLGWGSSRHGDIQASVEIQNGRIVSAAIVQCLTRYSCDVIDKLPPQVAARQSADVDYVSGATESADAFYDAIVDALSKVK
jgi:uncharacterized protein with FMN-binding domain